MEEIKAGRARSHDILTPSKLEAVFSDIEEYFDICQLYRIQWDWIYGVSMLGTIEQD